MDELKASGKPFQISKMEVWDAWLKVAVEIPKPHGGGTRVLGVGRRAIQPTRN